MMNINGLSAVVNDSVDALIHHLRPGADSVKAYKKHTKQQDEPSNVGVSQIGGIPKIIYWPFKLFKPG